MKINYYKVRFSKIHIIKYYLLLLFLYSGSAFGQWISWTGAVNSAWNNPSNWDLGYVPTANNNIHIYPKLNQPIINNGTNAKGNQIIIWQGSKVTINQSASLNAAQIVIEENAMFFKGKNYQDYNFSFKEFPPKNTRTKAIEPCQFYFKVEDNSVFYAFRKAKGGVFRGSFSATDFPNLELFKNFYSRNQ